MIILNFQCDKYLGHPDWNFSKKSKEKLFWGSMIVLWYDSSLQNSELLILHFEGISIDQTLCIPVIFISTIVIITILVYVWRHPVFFFCVLHLFSFFSLIFFFYFFLLLKAQTFESSDWCNNQFFLSPFLYLSNFILFCGTQKDYFLDFSYLEVPLNFWQLLVHTLRI